VADCHMVWGTPRGFCSSSATHRTHRRMLSRHHHRWPRHQDGALEDTVVWHPSLCLAGLNRTTSRERTTAARSTRSCPEHERALDLTLGGLALRGR
jgi:hypothetical protein